MEEKKKSWLTSSQHTGIKLRIRALLILLVPFVNELLKDQGFVLIQEDIERWIDGVFMAAFVVIEGWAWIRAYWKLKAD